MNKGKFIIKMAIFILIFCSSYIGISEIFEPYRDINQGIMSNFYKQEENSIDVVFIGSCHVYSTFMPLKLWDDYGVTSHILASSGQELQMSYYYLKEALKTQKPKVAVVDVYSINKHNSYISADDFDKSVVFGFESLKPSLSKIKYALDYDTPSYNKLELLFGLYRGHERWDYQGPNPITSIDFERFNKNYNFTTKGWVEYWNWEDSEDESALLNHSQNDEVVDFDDINMTYLQKIIELCDKEEIELILCAAPYNLLDVEMSRFNKVAEIANDKNIPFINFNKQYMIEALNLRYSDMTDFYHVDYSGAVKISDYINNFIVQNYNLENKKILFSDDFKSWNEDVSNFLKSRGLKNWYSDSSFQ